MGAKRVEPRGDRRRQNGVIIAGTHSGCGKTTVTMGIIAALRRAGLTVQPYKCGPDFIDPGFHRLAAGRACRNLDTRMLDDTTVRDLYARTSLGSDIAIVEGVMGLFDGAGPDDERGGAAHLARLLGLPVILVVDARAMVRSAAAVVRGFAAFDPEVRVAAVVLNRLGSARHGEMVRQAVEDATGVPVILTMERREEWSMAERHLGLVPWWLNGDVEGDKNPTRIDLLAQYVSDAMDRDLLLKISSETAPLSGPTDGPIVHHARGGSVGGEAASLKTAHEAQAHETRPVIAIAGDEAFSFYYEENLELLEAHGARLEFFSPIHDHRLPPGSCAIYIGGGYPELHAQKLSGNSSIRRSVLQAAQGGMPVYAECGGYMYLSRAIVDVHGVRHAMVGLFSGTARMGSTLRALGYADVRIMGESAVGGDGLNVRGHVFHWADISDEPDDRGDSFFGDDGSRRTQDLADAGIERAAEFSVSYRGETKNRDNSIGRQVYNSTASWLHLHFASNPQAARAFVHRARDYYATVRGRCPMCGEPNRCSVETGICWCFSRNVPDGLKTQIPAGRCICENCLNQYLKELRNLT